LNPLPHGLVRDLDTQEPKRPLDVPKALAREIELEGSRYRLRVVLHLLEAHVHGKVVSALSAGEPLEASCLVEAHAVFDYVPRTTEHASVGRGELCECPKLYRSPNPARKLNREDVFALGL